MRFNNSGMRISIPVKVMLFTGIVYLITWIIGVYLSGPIGVNFERMIFGVKVRYFYWTIQVLIVSLAATSSTYFFLDRPLKKLIRAMSHAEEGDFLVRAPILSDDELGELAHNFNQMLTRITDLAANKIEAEQDLIIAREELKYKKKIEEKSILIEKTNRTLESLVKDLSMIYEIGQEMNSVIDLEGLYGIITNTLKRYLMIHEFSILVFDDKKEILHVRAAFGFKDNDSLMQSTYVKEEGLFGEVAKSGKRAYVKDTTKEKRRLYYNAQHSGEVSSLLSVPLIYKDNILGVINYGRKGLSSFTFSDIKMLTLVAGHVALALANAKLYTKTRELSVKDELTQVYNRRHFQHMLQMEWKRSVRFNRDLSVVMLDVDYFKTYNDSFGHLQGDLVLRKIGEILTKNLREVDTVARFGGEEFILLLPDTDKNGAIAVAEKVRFLVENQRFTTEEWVETRSITISAGIASYPDDVAEMDDLIDHADIALYRAKETGRNRVICFKDPSEDKKENHILREKRTEITVEKNNKEITPPTKTLQ